jgi:hypothetical protein
MANSVSMAQGKGAPPGKQPDMEIDPDAKKPEPQPPPPLPPPEPGQWGVGGKEEQGKFAPGSDEEKKKKEEEKAKEEATPTDLGPVRSAYIEWVSGFGSIFDPTNNTDKTSITAQSFIFAFSWRVADIWTLGARFPFSQANITGPARLGAPDIFKTVSAGNLELYVRPSFQISPRLRVPAQVALDFPSAQGDLFGDTSMDQVTRSQALVNLAASASRGWEEMPLFTPHRFSVRAGAGITYDTEHVHVAADTDLDLMVRVGGNDPIATTCPIGVTCQVRNPALAWILRGSFFYGFEVGPGYIEPGVRAFFVYTQAPWYGQNNDDSGPQFVLEPAVYARYPVNEAKSMWVKGGVGFIAPVKSGPQGAQAFGVRVHAEFQF